ncbi:MAG: hypothetical protein AVDCRST_MAG67-485 [uncultured Solirubrobacteraceae bacterium]|uniref:Uncharacterized protein n=1 Tax=uncultured Solirubrobacteraceae bacterium TaxID=1162706 RepID=A0A6J4RQ60_9ACTN|nr:MAG: hypothetical protein AVDCRST_MAG67-485 [uncultured Solirubrobacteraceae bacterium]
MRADQGPRADEDPLSVALGVSTQRRPPADLNVFRHLARVPSSPQAYAGRPCG